jgi:hypothetical protein
MGETIKNDPTGVFARKTRVSGPPARCWRGLPDDAENPENSNRLGVKICLFGYTNEKQVRIGTRQ